jgi:hypothetical protein
LLGISKKEEMLYVVLQNQLYSSTSKVNASGNASLLYLYFVWGKASRNINASGNESGNGSENASRVQVDDFPDDFPSTLTHNS